MSQFAEVSEDYRRPRNASPTSSITQRLVGLNEHAEKLVAMANDIAAQLGIDNSVSLEGVSAKPTCEIDERIDSLNRQLNIAAQRLNAIVQRL